MVSGVTSVGIVGAGNVATHMARALLQTGIAVKYVCARSMESAARLAGIVGAQVCAGPADMPGNVDMVLISVSDSAVAQVAHGLPVAPYMVVHTSGSVPLSALSERHVCSAVLYPLQTFSRDIEVDMARVPLFIEASNPDSEACVGAVARALSTAVYHADSDRRRYLHVAGVMACNFPVYLLEQCRLVLDRAGYPLEVVRPLVEATLSKTFAAGPRDAMTGPARRGDMAVAKTHEQLLPLDVARIYSLISSQIYDMYHEQH